jgi:DNA-binding XRE family transcriptional regulator
MKTSRMTAGKESPNQQQKRNQALGSGLSALDKSSKAKDQSPSSYPSDPGEALKVFRERYKLARESVARNLDCSDQQIYNIESGKYPPKDKFAQAIIDLIKRRDPSAEFTKKKKNSNVKHSTANAQRPTPKQEAPTCGDCKQFQPTNDEFGVCSVGCYHKKRKATAPMCGMFEAKAENPSNVEPSTSNADQASGSGLSALGQGPKPKDPSLSGSVERQLERIINLAIDTASIFARATQILTAERLQGDIVLSAQALAIRSFARIKTLIVRAETLLEKNKHLAGSGLDKNLVLAKHHLRDSAIHLLGSRYAGEDLMRSVCEWLDEGIREEIKAMDAIKEWKSSEQEAADDRLPATGQSFRDQTIEK